MELLRSGADVAVIALWLGHERVETTSRIYLHADMSIKQRALDRTTPSHTKPGRYRTLTSCSPSSTTSDYVAHTPTSAPQAAIRPPRTITRGYA